MISNIRHIGIVVKDFERSLRFYKLIGFEESQRGQMKEPSDYIDKLSAGKNIKVTTIKLAAPDNSMIELLDYGDTTKVENRSLFTNGIAHFAVTVKDVEKVYERLVQEGIEFLSPPLISPNGFAKLAFCKAPEGTFIEIVQEL